MKQLICDNLNGVRNTQTIHATALYSPDRNASPPECMVARSWSIVIREQSQGEDCCCCGEMDGGDVWEEVVVGNVSEMPVEESRAAMEARRYC